MKWSTLPGPASFFNKVLDLVRGGISALVAAPSVLPVGFEDALLEVLRDDRWDVRQCVYDEPVDPLQWLTERLYLEPASWLNWSVDTLFEHLSPRQVIAIEGVTESNWDSWRIFLRDFELASRRRPSDERAVLLVFARGIPQKRLQVMDVALSVSIWSGVLGELDMLVYVDQLLRKKGLPLRHHKLIVRHISALALWDVQLADFLGEQPERDLFDLSTILRNGVEALASTRRAIGAGWEQGGCDVFDGVELEHPFCLVERADPQGELSRRLWAVQAAELLPLIEVRRRQLAQALQRHIPCPFWISDDRKVDKLEELEIGSLAHAAIKHKVPGDSRDKVEWLAECRNELAHLKILDARKALDRRLYE